MKHDDTRELIEWLRLAEYGFTNAPLCMICAMLYDTLEYDGHITGYISDCTCDERSYVHRYPDAQARFDLWNKILTESCDPIDSRTRSDVFNTNDELVSTFNQ